MNTKSIELTQEEATALVKLIDIAIKSGGINVAEAGVALVRKVSSPFNTQEEESVTATPE